MTQAPFLNIINEWYAKDTSKKIRAVFKAKGEAGKPLAPHPPYGYRKDPEDKYHWVVDEEAAEVVRKIFRLCIQGYGVSRIAAKLTAMKVDNPFYHAIANGIALPVHKGTSNVWHSATVSVILSRQEYLGHTVNFKTYSKSYKQKKRRLRDASDRRVFEHTHGAIVTQETFDIVQRIREGRRRATPMGDMPILSGMLFCADCGAKLYQVRQRGWKHGKEHFVCATYRKVRGGCTSHSIRNVVVEELLLESIRKISTYTREHEAEFVRMVTSKSQAEMGRSLRDSKRDLEQAGKRIEELDGIIQRLYEDNIKGKVSDERFAKMTANYEKEQQSLEARVTELRSRIAEEQQSAANAAGFLSIVRKYTDVHELTAEMIREFVEKIYVHNAEKENGNRVQKVRIVWNCIGEFDLESDLGKAKSA